MSTPTPNGSTTTTAQRPHSTLLPTMATSALASPRKRPTSLAGTTASPNIKGRQVLGNITVQSFQDRHRTEFAHLHTHSNDSLREKRLEAEKWELEEARRLGKEKRESLKAEAAAKVAAAEAGRRMEGKGRRPSSLVVKQSSTTSGPGPRPNSTSLSAPNANVIGSKLERPVSAPLAPVSALVSPRTSAGLGLDVVVENESGNTSFLPSTATATSTPTGEEEPSPDTSISQSSYSWASQFSGETEDLRIAARYVPKPRVHNHSEGASHEDEEEEGQEELDDEEDEEEVLASPNEDGTVRRRKKIVALAHTVRQLEGVGSREAEDPGFYATLVKAWNERPVAGGTTDSPYPATVSSDNGSSPYTPNLSSRHSDSDAHSYSHSKDDTSSFHSSSTGTGATRRSNSVRYSYASTLHDLAMEGGIEQANRIFLAKPWLRGSVVSATPNVGGAGGKEDAFGSNFARPPSSQAPPPRAEQAQEGSGTGSTERRLSLGSAPPALAPPIDLASGSANHGLRKAKGSIADLDASKSSAEADKLIESDSAAVPAASSWGLGFVNDWFATPTAPAATSSTDAQALTRSTTVAQFDDAPNDDSADVDDVDAEGETDYDFESAVEHEQGFHEGEGGQDHLDPELQEGEREGTRPESSLLAMPSQGQESAKAKAQSTVGQEPATKSVASKTITDSASSSSLTELAYAQDRPDSHMDAQLDPTSLPLPPTPTRTLTHVVVNGSPSSNPSRPLICSTHSITSYQPQLVHHQGLGLDTQVEGQTAIIEEGSLEEITVTTRDSYLSSDSYSSPLKSLATTTTTTSTKEKPVLAPIQTRRGLNLNLSLGSDSNLHLDAAAANTDAEGHPLRHHLSDPRFSNAYKLAQSLRVPTPTIKSPTRQSSINVLSTLLSPTSASASAASPSGLTSPTLSQVSTPDMQVSSRWFSQDSSEVETMMGGAPLTSPSASLSTSVSGRQSVQVQAQGRARSSTLLASPGALSPTSPNIVGNGVKTMRRPSRPTLLDTRAATLSSISELALVNGLHPSDIPNSISGGSEILSDSGLMVDVSGHPLDSPSMMSDLDTDSEFDYPPSTRRSRLAKSSLDSLPSYMRPPSISDSLSPSASASTAERRTSKYQIYQQRQAERSKRANARVAAKMSGATPQEMKKLERIQHQSMILGPLSSNNNNNNNLNGMETASMMVVPEPSKVACALFFLGFLGPWFWIFGGWMPLGHSSEVRKDEDTSLDFTAADHLPRWWRWTYHPDPWVKRNRRAAAVGVPVLVVGGVAAAIAVALVMA